MENKLANVSYLTLIPIHELYSICFSDKRYKFQFSVIRCCNDSQVEEHGSLQRFSLGHIASIHILCRFISQLL